MSSDVLLVPKKRHRASDVSKLRVRLAALFGFVLGFAMAFVTLLSYGDSVIEILSERPTTLMLATGEQGSSPNPIAASDVDLFQEVRIVCMILTYSDNYDKAFHLNATWGKRCNRLVFISDTEDPELGAINITAPGGYTNLWTKTREGFRYVYENLYDEADWFMKADDDTYVVMENLRYMLYGYDTNSPIYFGHKLKYEDKTAGARFVLKSLATLKYFINGCLSLYGKTA